MSTDKEWEQWGQRDPYFGVITDPRFRTDRLTDASREHFFATGREHVVDLLATIRRRFEPDFAPRTVLDFGCGVGRVLLPFARVANLAVGIDVSIAMLEETRRNADASGIANIELHHQGDLSGIARASFELVHSIMVLQHLDVQRGIDLFGQLVAAVSPGGIGAIQLTYAKAIHTATLGVPPVELEQHAPRAPTRSWLRRLVTSNNASTSSAAAPSPAPPNNADPAMLMNSYPLTPLFFHLQLAQVGTVYSEFTNHGGELGLFLFFQKP